jgi:16S rRNA (uracil1498-N3)-methyltransferase
MQLFYHPDILPEATKVFFTKEESRHISTVLRKQVGAIFYTTNGVGDIFTLQLTDAHPKKCMAAILSCQKQDPLPYNLHIAIAPTKLNERFEWFLEKATEIGITEITPLICERSERKTIKPERYEKIIVSAMKQSLKAYKPILNIPVKFTDFLTKPLAYEQLYIAHCEEDTDKITLKHKAKPKASSLILVGPEGDFSLHEITLAKENNFTPVSLGTSRLRTETAGIIACHSFAFINE